MKIKWKYLCHTCLAPLDPHYKFAKRWELSLFDEYLHETNLPFELNTIHNLKGVKVCKCCYMNKSMKYNPRIHAMRQTGMIKFNRPKTESITRSEMRLWVEEFHEILEEYKSKTPTFVSW